MVKPAGKLRDDILLSKIKIGADVFLLLLLDASLVVTANSFISYRLSSILFVLRSLTIFPIKVRAFINSYLGNEVALGRFFSPPDSPPKGVFWAGHVVYPMSVALMMDGVFFILCSLTIFLKKCLLYLVLFIQS